MKPERWEKIVSLAEAAAELGKQQRAAFLDEACAGDEALRKEVESLLASDEQAENFIEAPAIEIAADLIAGDRADSMVGREVGLYKIIDLLGAGGMGDVYLAQDTRLGRKVALKFLPAYFTNDKARVRRFEQEAIAASALNHPNILTIYEIGKTDGAHFMATEFVEGKTLRQHMESVQMTVREVLDVAMQVASALQAAHRAGIAHRDIKPENIMLRPDGYIKVLDFGLAKMTEQRQQPKDSGGAVESTSHTDAGVVMGTPHYMSPEQARGLKVDGRTDIFSLGAVIYEMLTSRKPFEGETTSHVIVAILEKDPPPISELLPDIPSDLERVIDRALRKDTAARYQTATDLMADLKSLRQQLESAKLASSPAPESKKNRKFIATLSIAGLILIALALTGLWLKANRANDNRPAIGSIAVLPFKLVDEEDRDHLGLGIADELITRLGALKQINVRPKEAILKYKEQEADPTSVGQEQQVDAVLQGRIQKFSERWHIAVQLTDTRDGSLLWKAEFDEDSSRLFAVESSIAQGLAEALKVKLGAREKQQFAKHYTENAEAHRFYTNGRYYWNKRDAEGCRKAIIRFQQAIDIDPTYALAWAGLADTYAFLASAFFDPIPPREDMEKAKAAAARALEFDDTLAEAHCAMAFVKGWYEFDWKGAEEELKRALELNPNYATAHQQYGWWFLAMGRMDEALAEMRRAQKLDPLSPPINSNIGAFLYFQRRYDESLAQFQTMFERDPIFSWNHTWIGWVYLEAGDFEKAIKEFKYETLPYEQGRWGLALAYARTGRTDEARKILDQFYQLARERYVSPTAFILIHIALGEKEKAFEWLEKAYEARDFDLCKIKVDPKLDPLRSDPRFADLLQRIGVN